jgi:hypothetical protein
MPYWHENPIPRFGGGAAADGSRQAFVNGVDAWADGAEIASGGRAPGDMVSAKGPPLPIDPRAIRARGPPTDPMTRQAIAVARKGMDLFIGSSFPGSLGNVP